MTMLECSAITRYDLLLGFNFVILSPENIGKRKLDMPKLNSRKIQLRTAREKRKLSIEALKRRPGAVPDDDPEFVPG